MDLQSGLTEGGQTGIKNTGYCINNLSELYSRRPKKNY